MSGERLKRWLARAGLLIAAFALVGSAISCASPEIAPQVDKQAPDFTLDTTSGTEITLSELRGTPVVLNFWAIYCPTCRAELVRFEAVAEQSNGDMAVITVNAGESRSKVEQFFGDYKIPFTVALDGDTRVSQSYNVRYIPTTFFIDSKGIIRYIKVGAFTSETELGEALESIQ